MKHTGPQPRLAVILHADVVGSTALVRRDERLAHERIRAAFEVFADAISRYGGTVREIRGDALVAEFTRASDALLAALAAQQGNATCNAHTADGIMPELRIGIALGEVVIADETVTGAGVVLAQRLEQLAERGGICISGAIREAAPDRLPLDYTPLGEHSFKGFDEPVRALSVALRAGENVPAPESRPASNEHGNARRLVRGSILAASIVLALGAWWVLGTRLEEDPRRSPPPSGADTSALLATGTSPTPAPAPAEPAAASITARSIAVLPFANMSNDPGQEYFSDGLTEDIITDLARISGLFVIARNSTFVYKGRAVDVKAIGRELGVRYVLEGSVRRAGERVRITAQLIDVESGMHLWANRYDRNLTDVFALQDELTRTIVGALEVNLSAEEADALVRATDVGTDAYDLLLRGNEVMARFSAQAMVEARAVYLQVLRLNPRYARAHANVAFTYAQEALFGWTDDVDRTIRLGFEAAEAARRLDDRVPQLQLTLANLYGAQLRWEDAAVAARRTVELEPSYADGHVMLAVAFTFLGQLDAAATAIAKAKRLNPHYSFIYLWVEARILYLQAQYEAAVELLEEAAQRNPDFDQVHIMLAAAYAQAGRIDDAQWEVEQVLLARPDYTIRADVRVRGFRDSELTARYVEGLRRAGLPEG